VGLLPNVFSGGNDKGQGVYAITEQGKIASDNGDLNNPKEIAIMQALDCIPSGTANIISKNSNVDKATVVALIGSLVGRKFVRKIN